MPEPSDDPGKWYSRPIFFVADVERSVRFYVDQLSFGENWRFEESGRKFVAQVARSECEIILSSQSPGRNGNGRLFVSLTTAGYAALPGELAAKGVSAKQGWWGYRILIVTDPDGNELYFPDPDDPGGGA